MLLIEREGRLGGILKQCIHDGFGLMRFKQKLSGPEYAERFIDEFKALGIPAKLWTFVSKVKRYKGGGIKLCAVSKDGVEILYTRSLILATGCRERTAKQVANSRNAAGRCLYCRNGPAFYKSAGHDAGAALCDFRQRRYRSYYGAAVKA